MKKLFTILLIFISAYGYSQNTFPSGPLSDSTAINLVTRLPNLQKAYYYLKKTVTQQQLDAIIIGKQNIEFAYLLGSDTLPRLLATKPTGGGLTPAVDSVLYSILK